MSKLYLNLKSTNLPDIPDSLNRSLCEIYNTCDEYIVHIGKNLNSRVVEYNYDGVNKAILNCLYRNVIYSVDLIYNLCKKYFPIHTSIEIDKETWINEFMYSLVYYGWEFNEYNFCDDVFFGDFEDVEKLEKDKRYEHALFRVFMGNEEGTDFDTGGYFFCIFKEMNNYGVYTVDTQKVRHFLEDEDQERIYERPFFIYGKEKKDNINYIINDSDEDEDFDLNNEEINDE